MELGMPIHALLTTLGLTLETIPASLVTAEIEAKTQDCFLRKIQQTDLASLSLTTSLFQSARPYGSSGIPYAECIRNPGLFLFSCESHMSSPNFSPFQTVDDFCSFDQLASVIAAQIITACKLDPASCTHSALEELNPQVTCVLCSKSNAPNGYFQQCHGCNR